MKQEHKIKLTGDDASRVTIYGWPMNLTIGQVGHVSLRTYIGGLRNEGQYMSFWPDEGGLRQKSLSGVFASHVHSLKDDIINEGNHEPEIIISLHSLNVEAINKAYQIFRLSDSKWSLLGSTYFRDPNTRNCSGLTGFLLAKGGIKNLVNSFKVDFDSGCGTAIEAKNNTLVPIAIGTVVTAKKVSLDTNQVKIAASVTLTAVASASTFLVNSAMTPNDIIKFAQSAYQAEQKIYEINYAKEEEHKNPSAKVCSII